MTLKIKNSDEWDGDSRMASYSSFDGNSHADQTRLMVDEQEQDQLVPNGGETEEMLDGQTAMVRIHENELKRRNSLHVTSHAGVVLRRKPKASSRPRLSLCLDLTSTGLSRSSLSASIMSSESEEGNDEE
jgi:hypothetical protein